MLQGQFYMRLHRTTVVLPPEEINVFLKVQKMSRACLQKENANLN